MSTQAAPQKDPTKDLILAAREGDLVAWERLDKRYRVALSLFLRGRIPPKVRRRFDTEDLLQSAFLCAFRELDSYEYKGEGSFLSWMIAILRNRLNSRLRKSMTKKERANSDYDESVDLDGIDKHESPSTIHAQAEESARLIQAIAELPDDVRDVVIQFHIDQKPQTHIARDNGESADTVRRKLARGLELIRKRLDGTHADHN